MKVSDMIRLLQEMPQDAEMMVDYLGYYEETSEIVEPYIDPSTGAVVIARVDATP